MSVASMSSFTPVTNTDSVGSVPSTATGSDPTSQSAATPASKENPSPASGEDAFPGNKTLSQSAVDDDLVNSPLDLRSHSQHHEVIIFSAEADKLTCPIYVALN